MPFMEIVGELRQAIDPMTLLAGVVVSACIFLAPMALRVNDSGGCWASYGPCRLAVSAALRVGVGVFACTLPGGVRNLLLLFLLQAINERQDDAIIGIAAYAVGGLLHTALLAGGPAPEPAPAQQAAATPQAAAGKGQKNSKKKKKNY